MTEYLADHCESPEDLYALCKQLEDSISRMQKQIDVLNKPRIRKADNPIMSSTKKLIPHDWEEQEAAARKMDKDREMRFMMRPPNCS